MALGDAGNQNNKQFQPSYWTKWSLKQRDGKYRLSPSFSNGLMTLAIQEQGDGYKYTNVASITLSPMKAKIFAGCIDQYLVDLAAGEFKQEAYGVDTGIKDTRPIIAITQVNGVNTIVIGKVDPNGNFESRVDYSLNSQYHYNLQWKNLNSMDVSKEYHDTIEIEELRQLCDDFSRSSYGAYAAATCEMMRWEYSTPQKIDAIASKLGVEMRGQATSTGNSYFNRDTQQRPVSSRSSIEELEEELG